MKRILEENKHFLIATKDYNKRLFQIIDKSKILNYKYSGTWCELFKTRKYKRSVQVAEKLHNHLEWYINKTIGNVLTYRIVKADKIFNRRENVYLVLFVTE